MLLSNPLSTMSGLYVRSVFRASDGRNRSHYRPRRCAKYGSAFQPSHQPSCKSLNQVHQTNSFLKASTPEKIVICPAPAHVRMQPTANNDRPSVTYPLTTCHFRGAATLYPVAQAIYLHRSTTPVSTCMAKGSTRVMLHIEQERAHSVVSSTSECLLWCEWMDILPRSCHFDASRKIFSVAVNPDVRVQLQNDGAIF